jgi:hypothetical protein
MNQEDWSSRKWRPYMAWMYMVICTFDFMIFPILWSMLQAHFNGQVTSQWDPLTLKGAGLFHMAMGAVIGVAAYGRTQEKLNGVTLPSSSPTTPSISASVSVAGSTRPTAAINSNLGQVDPPLRNTRND